jgi:hypothetical protein
VVSEAAAHHAADSSIAHASFVAHVDGILAEPLPPVTVLGTDETRLGRPVWTQDPETKKWVKPATGGIPGLSIPQALEGS